MPPYADTVLERERTAIIALNRGLEFRERKRLIQACQEWPGPTPARVIVDLSRLERIDVVTISAILGLNELLSKLGGRCSLRGCNPSVAEALRYLGLHRLIPIEE
jgi:anti-anti-sigma factor